MAVASGLPQLEEPAFQNSRLVDINGRPLGLLTGNQRRVVGRFGADLAGDEAGDHLDRGPPLLHERRRRPARHRPRPVAGRARQADGPGRLDDHAAVRQDRARGAARAHALQQDARGRAGVPDHAQVVQAADPAQLPQHDLLRQRRLRHRVGRPHLLRRRASGLRQTNKERPCAAQLEVQEAALLAGIVQSPSAYDPLQHPKASKRRRDLVLQRMLASRATSRRPQYEAAIEEPIPIRADVKPPREDTRLPVLHLVGQASRSSTSSAAARSARARPSRAACTVKTTLDVKLQDAADRAVKQWLSWQGGPRASMVVLDNDTGEVRAMVGGDDYATKPFNLATQGQRQPGSAFKPFVLAQALTDGISPSSVWSSHKLSFNLRQGARSSSRTTTTRTPASRRWRTRRRSPTTPSTSRSPAGSGPRRSRAWRARWASGRRSRGTSRSRSAACTRA